MLRIIPALTLLTVTGAAVISTENADGKQHNIPLLKSHSVQGEDGSYSFSYEGGDQSFREESSVLKNAGTDDENRFISGSYRYVGADGRPVEVRYTASRMGFFPVGTHIHPEISELAERSTRGNVGVEELLSTKKRGNF